MKKYKSPFDFRDDVFQACENRSNRSFAELVAKHVESCFFEDQKYIEAVFSLISDYPSNSVRPLLRKLDRLYTKTKEQKFGFCYYFGCYD